MFAGIMAMFPGKKQGGQAGHAGLKQGLWK
jgi:hypothetical protein